MADSLIKLPNDGPVLPIMTSTDRDAMAAPAEGKMIFNSTTGAINVRYLGAWVATAALS